MQFFLYKGIISDREKWPEEDNRHKNREQARQIKSASETFNQKYGEQSFFFVSDLYNGGAGEIAVITRRPGLIDVRLPLFLKTIGYSLDDAVLEEISFRFFRRLLQRSENGGFIEDSDDVLKDFDLDYNFSSLDFDETILTPQDKTGIMEEAEECPVGQALVSELERIYAKKASTLTCGHPVHYMLQTDDADLRCFTGRLLLQGLYDAQRLASRRYCWLFFEPGDNINDIIFDKLYQTCFGGTMMIRYDPSDVIDRDDTVSAEHEIIRKLCAAASRYRNDVLTVFCLPRECTRSKEIFYSYLTGMSFIEMKENFAPVSRAENFLKKLAKERNVRPDKKLTAKLDDRGYLIDELRALFNDWYDQKLKTKVYPQYKSISTVRQMMAKEEPKGDAFSEFSAMIGLTEAKKVLQQALNYHKVQKLYADMGASFDSPSMHMVFTGNPGTAKTSTARLFAQILKDNDILTKGHLVEVGRGDLVGKYVGWTAQLVQQKFKEAEGGVLFIDEAYALCDDRSGSFGDEAINTIVQEMENHRKSVVVIFAGYPKEMERFLNKNPGLRSRIAFHVPFDDYTTDELCRIAELIAKKKGMRLSEDALSKLTLVFDAVHGQEDFGNGRYARSVIEKARMAQASRLLTMDPDAVNKEDVITLRAEDIEIPPVKKSERRVIGFCS